MNLIFDFELNFVLYCYLWAMLSAEQQAEAEKRMKELAADQDAEKTIKNKISNQHFYIRNRVQIHQRQT